MPANKPLHPRWTSLATYRKAAASYIEDPAAREAIARLAEGMQSSVEHAASRYYRVPETCNCRRCRG